MPRSVRPSVRLSVPTGLGAQASCAIGLARSTRPIAPQQPCRPPELCGLRIRPRTDVDPPRSAEAYRLAPR